MNQSTFLWTEQDQVNKLEAPETLQGYSSYVLRSPQGEALALYWDLIECP